MLCFVYMLSVTEISGTCFVKLEFHIYVWKDSECSNLDKEKMESLQSLGYQFKREIPVTGRICQEMYNC